MSSSSGSDSESNHSRSASPNQGPAPTPGHGLERSPSNSPNFRNKSPAASPRRASRSRSGSRASSARSRSPSALSNKSGGTQGSRGSRKSSVASQHSNRSGSADSKKSRSRSRSSSAGSQKSGSRSRSGSRGSNKSRSRSRSRSGSVASNKTRSRSGSADSNRSRSKSRSRSGSLTSNRSKSAVSHRSKSAESNRSRHSGSRSRSQSQEKAGGTRENSRSRSNSPNLQIDEPGSPGSGDKNEESGDEKGARKKSRVIQSDSENEGDDAKKDEVSAAAIFGDADDISSEEEKEKDKETDKEQQRSDEEQERRSDEEQEQRVQEEDEDKENEPEPIPETRIDVEIPKISCDLGRDIHFVKLPNFLSVETRPFDPETYEDEIDEEETLDEEGRARLKLKVENTIRWREVVDEEGAVKKQSNARLVRWSDGSYSLHLGSEIFDVYKQPLQGDHNHLFIRQGTGLQGQAVFRTKLSFRPHSTESFTHRKMTLSLADRSQKTSGIKILSQVGADPDADRKELLKKEEEKLRQTVRASKPRARKGDSGARSHNREYREEDGSDEEGAISLNAIKNKYKSGHLMAAKGGAIYSSDEEGSDIETRKARKLDKAKVLKDSDSNEDSD